MKSGQWNNKLLLELLGCGILLIIGILFALTSRHNKQPAPKKEYNYSELILVDKLKFELNSELHLFDIIDKENKVEVTSENVLINTSELGEQTVSIKFIDIIQEVEKKVVINIVDTTGPVINFNNQVTTTVGRSINLLSGVSATDNSNEQIEVHVEGIYDFNRPGTYYLQYVAEDSSKNKTVAKFTLVVNKTTTTTTRRNRVTTTTTSSSNGNNTPAPTEAPQTTEPTTEPPTSGEEEPNNDDE